jgi:iron-sulfur cluster assembly protein
MTLQITPQAGAAIASLTSAQGVPDGGGLRLEATQAARDGAAGYDVTVAPTGDANDLTVVEQGSGARVFLDPVAADQLAHTTLDVDFDAAAEAGGARFQLTPSAS